MSCFSEMKLKKLQYKGSFRLTGMGTGTKPEIGHGLGHCVGLGALPVVNKVKKK